LKEAEDTGADTIVSICPFCFRNLKDAIEDTGSKMKMIDLMELVVQAIE
jgi:fumarate reductase (CoM/CoB) subunit B